LAIGSSALCACQEYTESYLFTRIHTYFFDSFNGPRFRVEHPEKANPLLIQGLVACGIPVIAVQEVPRTLEHVYLKAIAQAPSETRLLS